MLILKRMTASDYVDYAGAAMQRYANENVRSGKWLAEHALGESVNMHRELLPQGLHTKGHYFWNLFDDERNTSVGMLWFADIEKKRRAYCLRL